MRKQCRQVAIEERDRQHLGCGQGRLLAFWNLRMTDSEPIVKAHEHPVDSAARLDGPADHRSETSVTKRKRGTKRRDRRRSVNDAKR